MEGICSIFVLAKNTKTDEIFKIEVDRDTQKTICDCFFEAKNNLIKDKERKIFSGDYKPEENEFLAIENFKISDAIKNAIHDPLGIKPYQKPKDETHNIKTIFIGQEAPEGSFEIAFQKFKNEQFISPKRFNLFFDKNTFFRQTNFGISISNTVDCCYVNGELQFTSFSIARQIFDLGEYYRSATDEEVTAFSKNQRLKINDSAAFIKMADSWIRRKIALISDSQVLEIYSANEIARRANETGISINTKGNKIIMPDNKKQLKIILGFLDEEAYKGPFSQETFIANSKYKLEK